MRALVVRRTVLAVLPVLALALACSPGDDDNDPQASPSATTEPTESTESTDASESPVPDGCAKEELPLLSPGMLTIGTDSPAHEPWFVDNDPSNGKGFESAVAYAVAEELGLTRGEVVWIKVPLKRASKKGVKNFDFDINQIPITPARAEVVDFSDGYYDVAQGVIALKRSPVSEVTSLAGLADYNLGAQTGTTSLTAIRDVIKPANEPAVFEDIEEARQALLDNQVDAILVDLPTAFSITAQIPKGTIVGQFQPTTGEQEELGLLLEKGSPLVKCVNHALFALESDGTLAEIEKRWLSDVVGVPELR